MRTKNIIEEKQNMLRTLQSQSSRALDIVTSTINQLATVNEKIDVTISEINEAKAKLQSTEDDLSKTRLHNTKIIDKFRALIEEQENYILKKIVIKIIALAIVFGIFEVIGLYISPLFENSLAMNQMSYSFESSLLVQAYDYISNYSWIAYILLTILVFRKEILKVYKNIKKVKENVNEEN